MSDARFDPHRFQTTVPYYARFRVPYPPELIRFVAGHVGLPEGAGVLDLGTGPGLLAIAFARLGHRVTAMDPEPAMLEAAQAAAQEAGVEVDFVRASSFDLDSVAGPYDLVTMGRSFHWMDREATLAILDRLMAPAGAIALFGDSRIPTPGQDWRAVVETLAATYAPDQARERQARRSPTHRPHEAVLLESAFNRLEHYGIITRHTVDLETAIGRTLSMSVTSPEALGERREAFETQLRHDLAAVSPDGRFEEIVEVKALIARRGASAVNASGQEHHTTGRYDVSMTRR